MLALLKDAILDFELENERGPTLSSLLCAEAYGGNMTLSFKALLTHVLIRLCPQKVSCSNLEKHADFARAISHTGLDDTFIKITFE